MSKRSTISISALLLLLSLTQNAYYVTGMEESAGSLGLLAFLLGWMDVFGAGISWLANPILLFSWLLLGAGNFKASLIAGIAAVVFSLSFMLFDEIIANEGGGKSEILAYGTGYWLWLSSCGINLIGNLILYPKGKTVADKNLKQERM
jgi:hypothetical protein